MPRIPPSGTSAKKQRLARRNLLRLGTSRWGFSTLPQRLFAPEPRIYTVAESTSRQHAWNGRIDCVTGRLNGVEVGVASGRQAD